MEISWEPTASIALTEEWLKAFVGARNETGNWKTPLHSTLFCRKEKLKSYKNSKEINENIILKQYYYIHIKSETVQS